MKVVLFAGIVSEPIKGKMIGFSRVISDLGMMQRWEMEEADAQSLISNASEATGNNYRARLETR